MDTDKMAGKIASDYTRENRWSFLAGKIAGEYNSDKDREKQMSLVASGIAREYVAILKEDIGKPLAGTQDYSYDDCKNLIYTLVDYLKDDLGDYKKEGDGAHFEVNDDSVKAIFSIVLEKTNDDGIYCFRAILTDNALGEVVINNWFDFNFYDVRTPSELARLIRNTIGESIDYIALRNNEK